MLSLDITFVNQVLVECYMAVYESRKNTLVYKPNWFYTKRQVVLVLFEYESTLHKLIHLCKTEKEKHNKKVRRRFFGPIKPMITDIKFNDDFTGVVQLYGKLEILFF